MIRVPETNAEVIADFRANGGEVASPYDNPPPMLLLHTIGARSGREHIVPMRGLPDGDALYVFGSAHGSARHPDWYYNVVAHPEFVIEKGTETIPVHATELQGAEREAVFARQAARFPVFTDYQRRLRRTIPVIRLDRRPLQEETQRAADEIAFNAEIVREFRANQGQVGGHFEGSKLLILGTTGAKTGKRRSTPLAYLANNDRLYVFAAGPYAPHPPHWYFNLLAQPDVTVEVGADAYPATARVLAGGERDRIWELFATDIPQLPGWQRDAGREFPLIELTRRA